MKRIFSSAVVGFAVTLTLPVAGFAQSPPSSSAARPPIRAIGAVIATSTDSLGVVTNVRQLPGGRVLVNDASHRRVLLLDSTMKLVTVVADSTSSTANAYGPRSGSLIAYRGDSTLFVDAASLSMLVIDPAGKIARVMSVPRSQDAMSIVGLGGGPAGYDGVSKLIYRAFPGVRMTMGPGGIPTSPEVADTAAIVRVDLVSRKVDTAGFVKVPKTKTQINRSDDGKISIAVEVNPLPLVDEWAVTSDGSLAFVRGRDYHIDWVKPDGSRSSSPKVNFDWKRLSDEQKVEFLDSLKIQRERFEAANPGNPAAALGAALGMGAPAGGGASGGAPQIRMEMRTSVGGASSAPQISMPVISYVSASELPDYQPPFFSGQVRADADGNIWVHTTPTKPTPGGAVYDIISLSGAVVERVQLPENRTLVGFGSGGVVFLGHLEGANMKIERAQVR